MIISTQNFRLRGAETLVEALRARLVLKDMRIAELEATAEVLARKYLKKIQCAHTKSNVALIVKTAKTKARKNVRRKKSKSDGGTIHPRPIVSRL